VETTFSFAISPVIVDTADCQSPKPSGAKMKETALPIIASSELSCSSTILNPFSNPNPCRNHRIIDDATITVPALFIKLQPRSHVA
jgi:hypothetical protein